MLYYRGREAAGTAALQKKEDSTGDLGRTAFGSTAMTQMQRRIGVGGAIVFVILLLYLPWRVEYERGFSRITYSFAFSPPNDFRRSEGNMSIPPQTVFVDVWMLLGELVAVAAITGFLLWVYRPAGAARTVPGEPTQAAPQPRPDGATP